jgi:hypothetical protein
MLKRIFSLCCLALMVFNCFAQNKPDTKGKGLKDYYASYFTIGGAVSPRALKQMKHRLSFGNSTA